MSIKTLQANAILKQVHGVLADMMQTSGLAMSETFDTDAVDTFIMNAAWAIHATHDMVLQLMPGTAIFG